MKLALFAVAVLLVTSVVCEQQVGESLFVFVLKIGVSCSSIVFLAHSYIVRSAVYFGRGLRLDILIFLRPISALSASVQRFGLI